MKYKLAIVIASLGTITLLGSACIDFSAEEIIGETKYKIELMDSAAECSSVAEDVAEGYENADINDEEWCASMKENCTEIRDLCDEARDIDPPESMEENHEKYLEALAHYETAADLLEDGIDEGDDTLVEQSQAEMEEGNAAMEEFYDTMDEEWVDDMRDKYEEEYNTDESQ